MMLIQPILQLWMNDLSAVYPNAGLYQLTCCILVENAMVQRLMANCTVSNNGWLAARVYRFRE